MQRAKDTMDAIFEFLQKSGIDYYCFHDRDIAPQGETFTQTCKNLEAMVEYAKKLQKETGVKLLMGNSKFIRQRDLFARSRVESECTRDGHCNSPGEKCT